MRNSRFPDVTPEILDVVCGKSISDDYFPRPSITSGRRHQIRLPNPRGYIRAIRRLQLGIQGADQMRVGFALAPLRPAVGRFLPLQEVGGIERSCA